MISITSDLLGQFNKTRASLDFLGIRELQALAKSGNCVLDPFSTLISKWARIGENNVFYPSVVIQARNGGRIEMGNRNIFYPQSFLLADLGAIVIGNDNQFGDGGLSI